MELFLKNLPQSVEINYLSESVFNEEVYVHTVADRINEGFYNHMVCRASDNKELCRVRIGWNSKVTDKV